MRKLRTNFMVLAKLKTRSLHFCRQADCTKFTYDTLLRMSGIKNANGGGTTLSQYTYTYDAVNRLTTEVLGGNTKTFTYDVRSQLTGDGTSTYGYDNAGNRNNGGQTITTGNRLAVDANWNYTYDDEGNLTGKTSVATPTVTWTYTWDVNNRMVAAVKSAGSSLYNVDYKYDVFGNRIEQIVDADGAGAGASVTTRFAWEGAGVLQDAWGNRTAPVGTENWNIWADLNGSNGLVTRYVRGYEVDQLFSRVKADGTVAHYLTDRMQSTRQMLDASGTVANTITYDGFGNVLSETDAAFGDRWKWTGREYNNYTGLQYNRARYYSGESGRWVSEDPLGFGAGDFNYYRNVENNITTYTDPSGLWRFGFTLNLGFWSGDISIGTGGVSIKAGIGGSGARVGGGIYYDPNGSATPGIGIGGSFRGAFPVFPPPFMGPIIIPPLPMPPIFGLPPFLPPFPFPGIGVGGYVDGTWVIFPFVPPAPGKAPGFFGIGVIDTTVAIPILPGVIPGNGGWYVGMPGAQFGYSAFVSITF